MGSPPVDGGRHRQLEPDIGAPRTIMFSTSLPDRDIDHLTVCIPAPRPPLDSPTDAIRHVVVPPEPSYDPYWDGDVVHDRAYEQRTPPTRGGRWGVVLGALVVTGCAAYIAVVGISGLRGGAVAPASTTLAAPQVSATFPASAVPPATAATPTPTARAAIPRRTPVARSAAPVTTTPPAVTVAPSSKPALQAEEPVRQAEVDDGTPQLADPPPDQSASPAPKAGSRAQTGPTATPPSPSSH
jgi:hypothetical protein